MKELLTRTSKTVLSGYAKFALVALATLGAAGMASACSSDSSSSPGDGGSGSSGSHSGSSSGSASGRSSGSASGSISGAMGDAGDAGGSDASDATTGDDGGDGAAPYVPETCTSACMTATGCPTPSCYAASANRIADPATAAVPANLLYPQFAHDGILNTRYSTGTPAVGVEWFQVDLCRTASVGGVTLDDSSDPGDQAVAYTVQVSLDGTTWTQVAIGSSIPAMDASAAMDSSTDAMDSSADAMDSSADASDSTTPAVDSSAPAAAPAILTIAFAPVMARYVRVNQTGMLPTSARTGMSRWWSIDEISVACPGTGGDAAPAADSSSDVAIDVASQ